MNEWSNKLDDCHIPATRFIASWLRKGGQLRYGEDYDNFYEWLLLVGLTEDDAKHVVYLAQNGKCELECSAKLFLQHKKLGYVPK